MIVEVSGLQKAKGSLNGVVGGQDHVGLLAVDFVLTDHDGVGHLADEAVNVDTQVDLDEVARVEGHVFGSQG